MRLAIGLLPALLHGFSALPALGCDEPALPVVSPDGRLRVDFCLRGGEPVYSVARDGKPLVEPSALGLEFRGLPGAHGFRVAAVSRSRKDETWEQPWGEDRYVRDRHEELRVTLAAKADPARAMTLVFRAFDDGLGFRYEVPRQPGLEDFVLDAERTEFRFARELDAWWIPAFTDMTSELLYRRTPLAAIDVAHTPLTLEGNGLVVSLHEAALVDYAAMTLRRRDPRTLAAELTPWADGARVKGRTPFATPWRTLQIADTAAGLLESRLILNLNEPSRLADTSWIRPMKYLGIWWGMHLGELTWGSGPNRGATTARASAALSLAGALGIPGLLIEGWNEGWDGDWTAEGHRFDFTRANPEFDLPRVAAEARSRGVALIGHHETGGAVANYEAQLEPAFALYERLGVTAVKTGYVGKRVEGGEWHEGQRMVRHHQLVTETAARHRIMLDLHEPVKDTGLRRTYPNLMTREGARGTEFDAWSGADGNPPSHTAILPFTRCLAGPLDFTPGIFDLLLGGRRGENRVRTTLAKQLALYVVIHSPLQMAADLPERYVGMPAFQFIRDVPVDWHATRGLGGEIGRHVTVARRDRNSEDWYLGSLTNEEPREIAVPLGFLDPGRRYLAEIYRDGPGASWRDNPSAHEIVRQDVTAADTLALRLAPGGGQAIRFRVQP